MCRDSLIVAIGDAVTCVFGGFVIFSFLGYMAGQLQVDVKDVVKDGNYASLFLLLLSLLLLLQVWEEEESKQYGLNCRRNVRNK